MAKILFAQPEILNIVKLVLEDVFGHQVKMVTSVEGIEPELIAKQYDILVIEPFLKIRGSSNGLDDYQRKCLLAFEGILENKNLPKMIIASTFAFCDTKYYQRRGLSSFIQQPYTAEELQKLISKVLAE